MMVDPNGPVGKNAHLWWNNDFDRMLTIWCCGIPMRSPCFRSKSTELTACVPAQPGVYDGSWILVEGSLSQRFFPQTVATKNR